MTDSVLERWSMPTRFNTRYLQEVIDSGIIHLVENVEAQEIEGLSGDQVVRSVRVWDRLGGKAVGLKASSFVLAMGAQEATRFLLKSRKKFPSIAGDGSYLGRFYQGHISGKIASVQFSGKPEEPTFAGVFSSPRRQSAKSSFLTPRYGLIIRSTWIRPTAVVPCHSCTWL